MEYRGLSIKWLGHSGFKIQDISGKTIYIDPFQLGEGNEKADMILITHAHYDHCSIEDIKKILKSSTVVIGPSGIQSKIRKAREGIDFKIIEPGSFIDNGFEIGGVSAYNIDKVFHPKENYWLGYIINIKGVKIYHAGDTDIIPEMKNVKADVIFLPIGGKFTMNAEEAAEAAFWIKPDLAIPMHFGSIVGSIGDAERFVQACREKGINAKILEKEI